MSELYFRDPLSNFFKEIEALMNYDYNRESKGLRPVIKRPHNLLTHKNADGVITSYEMQLVYTPFSKKDVSVEVLNNVLTVKCGTENKIKNDDMTYCGISNQSYEFSLPLSDNIDTKSIAAKAEDGMLYILFPIKVSKEVEEQPTKIEIM